MNAKGKKLLNTSAKKKVIKIRAFVKDVKTEIKNTTATVNKRTSKQASNILTRTDTKTKNMVSQKTEKRVSNNKNISSSIGSEKEFNEKMNPAKNTTNARKSKDIGKQERKSIKEEERKSIKEEERKSIKKEERKSIKGERKSL